MIVHATTAAEGLRIVPPGAEPVALRDVAARLRRIAQGLDDAIADSRSIAHDERFWSGTAADAFRHRIDTAPKHLSQVVDRYRNYAAALSDYADVVDVDRRDFAVAQQALRDADHAVNGHAAAGHAAAARAAGPDAAPAAEQRVAQALRTVNECLDRAAHHARQCARRLHHVDDSDDLHNPHGWHAVIDNTSTVLGRAATVTAVLAVVAAIVFPPAGMILLAAAAGLSAARLGADSARRWGYDEDVSWVDLGVDAIGVIPLGGAGGAARAGVAAARASTASGAVGGALGTGLRTAAGRLGTAFGEISPAGIASGVRQVRITGFALRWPGHRVAVTRVASSWQEIGGAVDSWCFGDHAVRGDISGRWAEDSWRWRSRAARIGPTVHPVVVRQRLTLTPRIGLSVAP